VSGSANDIEIYAVFVSWVTDQALLGAVGDKNTTCTLQPTFQNTAWMDDEKHLAWIVTAMRLGRSVFSLTPNSVCHSEIFPNFQEVSLDLGFYVEAIDYLCWENFEIVHKIHARARGGITHAVQHEGLQMKSVITMAVWMTEE
jgi:hypothetical protein